MLTIEDLREAQKRISGHLIESPTLHCPYFSGLTGNNCFFKMENIHRTGAFKERGALNKLLIAKERGELGEGGVITASAGNHGQGVAHHSTRLGVKSMVVMPENTPLIKVHSVRDLGAKVILHGSTFDDAFNKCMELKEEKGLTLIHPFNDLEVIAGQGTIGLEILNQVKDLDMVIIPVGGGGLASGISLAIKSTNPDIKVIGVEAEKMAAMTSSMEIKRLVTLKPQKTIADGIAVKRVGDVTFDMCKKYVDELVTLTENEIASSILQLLEKRKTLIEGAGACSLGALLHKKVRVKDKNVCMILSGGNIDINLLSRIIDRGLVREGRLINLQLTLSDLPGTLAELCRRISALKANIMQIQHDRAFSTGLGFTLVDLQLETRGWQHIDKVIIELKKHYSVEVKG